MAPGNEKNNDTKQNIKPDMEDNNKSVSMKQEKGHGGERNHHDRGRERNRHDRGRGGGRGRGGRGGGGGSHFRDRSEINRNDNNEEQMMMDMQAEENQEEQRKEKKKFTGRCRLFVGNLPPETDEEEFKKMFLEYGEVSEVYVNKQKAFGFIRLDTRHNAEKAKDSLDGTVKKGRTLRVRFATHGAALRVKHISPYVSNELLEDAFSIFGQVERALVIVDDRGRSTGEGIVEFARKPGAQKALQAITEGVFLLTSSPKPVIAEPLDQKDEEDGLPERYIQKSQQLMKEREVQPRLAKVDSFEFEFGQRWKQLYDMEVKEKERLKKEMEDAVDKLEMEMVQAGHEQQANLLRQELRRLEEMQAQEQMRRREMSMRRQEEDRMRREEEQRRMAMRQAEQEKRQQMMRSNRMDDLFDNRMMGGGMQGRMDRSMMSEMGDRDMGREMENREAGRDGAPPLQPPPAPPAAMLNREDMKMGMVDRRQSRFDQPAPPGGNRSMGQGSRDMRNMDRRDRRDEFDSKRSRRY